MAMHQENLGAALALAAAGIRIFPAGQDKRPLLKGWQEAATCNADQINEWWEHSTALPAIPCGQNGLLVIDCDRHGGPDGVEAFRKLVAANGGLPPDMPVVSTPSRGAHLYFKQPNGEALDNSRGTLPKAVDCRGSGGFVIGPGARLPDGRGWTAVAGRAPIHQAPPVPHWIEQILRPPQREEAREPNNSDETNEERGRAYAMAALDGVETELAAAPTGERNDRLYKTAFRLATMAARGWLMESEIIETLMRACEANQYLREHGHRATTKTIESGISDGLKVPHDDLEDRGDAERVETGAGTQQKQPRQEQRKQEERTQR
jgi:Bifunctional DNA primase/polymerase, N-terminal